MLEGAKQGAGRSPDKKQGGRPLVQARNVVGTREKWMDLITIRIHLIKI